MSILSLSPAPRCAPVTPCLAVATFLAALLAAPPCFADNAITLQEAQSLALQRSRQLVAQEHSADAARQMAVAAAQLPDPVLKAGIDNLPLSGADRYSLGSDFMTMRRFGIAQELTSVDKRQRRAELFERERDKALEEKRAMAAKIERETATAWLEAHFSRQAERLIAGQLDQAANEIEAAEAAFRGGRGSLADIAAARAALVQEQDRGADAQRRSRNAAAMLARWTGLNSSTALAHPPLMESVQLNLDALDMALAHHPDVTVLLHQEQVALAEAQVAQAATKPDWSVEVAFQQRGSAYSNMVSVGISVPLQWDRPNRQHRDVAAKLALVEAVKAQREEAERDHLVALRTMAEEWRSNRSRVARLEHDLIPLSRQRSEAVLAAYRGGKASLTDLLASRRGETEVALQVLQLQAETARLWAQLNYQFPSNAAGEVTK